MLQPPEFGMTSAAGTGKSGVPLDMGAIWRIP
jgi:hypothetical protein